MITCANYKQADKLKLAVVYELIISNPSPQVIHSLAKRHHSEATSPAERHHGEAASLFPQVGNFRFIELSSNSAVGTPREGVSLQTSLKACANFKQADKPTLVKRGSMGGGVKGEKEKFSGIVLAKELWMWYDEITI